MQANGDTGTTVQPGDVVNGGAGTDTLSIAVAGALANAGHTISALRTSGVEKVLLNNFNTNDLLDNTVDTALMSGLTTVGVSASSAAGDTIFSNMTAIVAAEMTNGAGDLTLTYSTAAVAGTADSQTLSVSNLSAGTFTANGIETLNINSGLVKSTLAAVVSDKLKTVNVTGATDLTITAAVDFVAGTNDDTTIDATIDASTFTGKLSVVASDANDIQVKGGSGNDTIAMGAALTSKDKIDGGAGTDTLTMTAAALSTQFAGVSNIETVAFTASTGTVAMDVSKLSAGVTTVEVDHSDSNDNNTTAEVLTISNLDGQAVTIKHTTANAGAGDSSDADGASITITGKTDTAADTVNIKLAAIDTEANDKGLQTLNVANFETVNIESALPTTGTVTNQVTALTATSAKAVNVSGAADLTLTAIGGGAMTSLNASALAGKLTATLAGDKVAVTLGQKDSTINFGTTLDNNDAVTGGAGKDTLTAEVNGLTATTGKLNISGVETVTLTTSGANTLDLSGVVGATTVSVSANTQTITGLNLATNLVATDAATLKVTAANATGASDTLTVEQKLDANTTNVIEAKSIENLSLILNDTNAGAGGAANSATFTISAFEGNSITVTESASTVTSGVNVALGNLHKNVTSVNTSGVKGTQSASAAASTAAVTFSLGGSAAATIIGSDLADTFNIASSGAVVHAITGGTGTDTTNIAVKAGWENPSDIATENLNITINPGDDITLLAGEDFNAVTTAIKVAGGNSLSTFSNLANTNTYLADAVKTFDASAFTGNITVGVASDKFDDTVTITGGAMTTDSVTATYATAGTYKPKTVAVETLKISAGNNATAETITIDLSNTSGVTAVEVNNISTNAVDTVVVDKIVGQKVVVSGNATTGNIIEAKLVDATGTADALAFEMKAAATITGALKLKTTDVEALSIKAAVATNVDLSNVSITAADKFAALTVTGDKALTISALNADVNVIDASGMTTGGSVVQTGRSGTTAATYTGSAGADTFIMANTADVIAAGEGSDTLDINVTAVLGGIVVDLSATDVVVQANGSLNTTVQSGFINVDLAGYAGGYGAVVTANKAGSTITGTGATDQITGGAGADTVIVTAGNDVVAAGEGNDTIKFTAALIEANSGTTATFDGGTGTNIIEITAATTGLVDADLRGVTLIQTLTLANGTNSIALGSNATAAGIVTVNGGTTAADTVAMTKAYAETTGLTLNLGTTSTDTIIISDSGAVTFANATIATADALTVAADAGADAIVIKQAFFDGGGAATAATLTITGGADADNDTLTILAGATAWDAAASADAAAVVAAGDWFLADVNDDNVLTYYNEAGATVVTLTLVGLDAGAVAITANNLVWTA